MEKPIICCSDGEPGQYVEKTKSGLKIKYEDLDEFIDAGLKLKSNPELCYSLGQNGRKFIEENLTFEKINHSS